MSKMNIVYLITLSGLILFQTIVTAQEFPIAAGQDTAFTFSAAFDGTNYLVGIQGDISGQSNITAQLVSSSGSLVGSRITVGRAGGLPIGGPMIAFAGSQYLLVWTDTSLFNIDVYGQFVDPSGTLTGTAFPIASTTDNEYCGDITAGDSTYLVVWWRNDFLYGQLLNQTGDLIGSAQPISDNTVPFNMTFIGETALAFDGTNYLVVWQQRRQQGPESYDVQGRFISESGSATNQFTINQNPSSSFNPLSLAFDGSNYLVAWNKDIGPGYPSPTIWDIYARKVPPSGIMGTPEFPIATTIGDQIHPAIAFDGTNYLITWNEVNDSLSINKVVGRFFDTSGVPTDSVFTIFDTLENKFPLNGRLVFGGSQYLSIASRITAIFDSLGIHFTDSDVYGMIIQPSTTGIETAKMSYTPSQFSLSQNYPNPFNPRTVISWQLARQNNSAGQAVGNLVNLKIYDALGREVQTLVNEVMPAGNHSVVFDAAGLPSGLYFYRLEVGGLRQTRQMLLLR